MVLRDQPSSPLYTPCFLGHADWVTNPASLLVYSRTPASDGGNSMLLRKNPAHRVSNRRSLHPTGDSRTITPPGRCGMWTIVRVNITVLGQKREGKKGGRGLMLLADANPTRLNLQQVVGFRARRTFRYRFMSVDADVKGHRFYFAKSPCSQYYPSQNDPRVH